MRQLPGTIIIRGLRCHGRQGPTAGDREQTHEYLVDIGVSADLADAVARDDLAAAIDIAALASCVRDEVARRRRDLKERQRMATLLQFVLPAYRADRVRIAFGLPIPSSGTAVHAAVIDAMHELIAAD